ncbi:MAG: DUF502 domain-containing protein [Verrucomicrobia bacterium]|nr:DUF502 domain-containing protein [Verrucomicrobiota bacterium]
MAFLPKPIGSTPVGGAIQVFETAAKRNSSIAMKKPLAHWKANFFTGLAVVLPALLSIGAVVWLFGTVSNVTDALLFFLPKAWTHERGGEGPMHWYWSLCALALAIGLITLVGRFARHYLGRKLIRLADDLLLRVPLLNKIYGALKQINEAFTSSKNTAFQQVVLIEFPRAGLYSIGFITGDQHGEVQHKTREEVVSVFVPTTPNPTSGFIVLAPKARIVKLDMSVADGIKFIMSLGSVAPDYVPVGGAAIVNGARVAENTPALGAGGEAAALAASVPSPAGTRAADPAKETPQN